jgi:nitrite reductase (NADH) large subunit
MNSDSNTPPSRTVCFCYNVTEAQIKEAIQSGIHTLEGLKASLHSSTGCTGCESEVIEILEATLKELGKEP